MSTKQPKPDYKVHLDALVFQSNQLRNDMATVRIWVSEEEFKDFMEEVDRLGNQLQDLRDKVKKKLLDELPY